jgi:mono/diheme cytochrome c family protein
MSIKVSLRAAMLMATLSASLLAAMTLQGWGDEETEPGSVSAQSIETQFRLYCAGCHGEGGVGDGPIADTLEKRPADLTTLAKRNGGVFPRERVLAVIDGREEVKQHGDRDMPVWADWFKLEAGEGLGGAEGSEKHVRARIEKMVDFLETLQQK